MAAAPSVQIDWAVTGLGTAQVGGLLREAKEYAEHLAVSAGREANGLMETHGWAWAKTQAIYPPPREHRTQPQYSTAWVHWTFFLGYVAFFFVAVTTPSLVRNVLELMQGLGMLSMIAFIGAWVMAAKAARRSNEARTAQWWRSYDLHIKERLKLHDALLAAVRAYFTTAHAEYYRPVASVPAPEVNRYPREGMTWAPRGARPEPMASCTDRQAEFLAKRWMEFLGEDRCVVSAATRDGGADVVSERFMAEVKHHASVISPAMVRAVVGVAHVEGKRALFFALSGYTPASVEFADRAGAALFVYDYARGTLTARSKAAMRALAEGLPAIVPGP